MPKLPPDMNHKTTYHEINEFMNEYYSDQEQRSRPPDPAPQPSNMAVRVDLTGTETFQKIINVLHFAFKRADLDTQRQIYHKLKREIGHTHDLKAFER